MMLQKKQLQNSFFIHSIQQQVTNSNKFPTKDHKGEKIFLATLCFVMQSKMVIKLYRFEHRSALLYKRLQYHVRFFLGHWHYIQKCLKSSYIYIISTIGQKLKVWILFIIFLVASHVNKIFIIDYFTCLNLSYFKYVHMYQANCGLFRASYLE